MLTLIAAKTKNNVIGLKNSLPWKQKHDMQRFKALTYGKTVVMGRKTYDSMGSKPLVDRENIIISKAAEYDRHFMENGQVITILNTIYPILHEQNISRMSEEVFVIGGAMIYELFLPYANKIHLTELDCELDGDAFFPKLDSKQWKLIATESYSKDEHNQYDYKFLTYVRKK